MVRSFETMERLVHSSIRPFIPMRMAAWVRCGTSCIPCYSVPNNCTKSAQGGLFSAYPDLRLGSDLLRHSSPNVDSLSWAVGLDSVFTNRIETLNRQLRDSGPLHTRAKSRDHEIVTAQKKVPKGHPNTPPKSGSVVTGPKV